MNLQISGTRVTLEARRRSSSFKHIERLQQARSMNKVTTRQRSSSTRLAAVKEGRRPARGQRRPLGEVNRNTNVQVRAEKIDEGKENEVEVEKRWYFNQYRNAKLAARFERLSNDNSIETTKQVELSLICPVTLKRIAKPQKFVRCDHLECIDLDAVRMLMRNFYATVPRPESIKCPICWKEHKLHTDLPASVAYGYDLLLCFILERAPTTCNKVIIDYNDLDKIFFYPKPDQITTNTQNTIVDLTVAKYALIETDSGNFRTPKRFGRRRSLSCNS